MFIMLLILSINQIICQFRRQYNHLPGLLNRPALKIIIQTLYVIPNNSVTNVPEILQVDKLVINVFILSVVIAHPLDMKYFVLELHGILM